MTLLAPDQVDFVFDEFDWYSRSGTLRHWELFYIISTSLREDAMEDREEFVEFIDSE